MKFEMVMPKMGESIMDGTILKWLKQPGEGGLSWSLLDRRHPWLMVSLTTSKILVFLFSVSVEVFKKWLLQWVQHSILKFVIWMDE